MKSRSLIGFTRYVAGFLLNRELTRVVLIRKRRPLEQAGKLNGVGGKVEPFDKSTLAAMQREFYEEARLQIPAWNPLCRITDGESWEVDFFWAISDRLDDVRTQTDEAVGVYPLYPHSSDRMANLRWMLPMIESIARGEERANWFEMREFYSPSFLLEV